MDEIINLINIFKNYIEEFSMQFSETRRKSPFSSINISRSKRMLRRTDFYDIIKATKKAASTDRRRE